ncbi:type I phosphomannose isomerase catalytic subunit [Spiroplasma chrysopicola]|uniref:Mannose-6-phosphate isomerase n=1 Tax=Spiroplasma chrysopicola DF-1 TaxID=1276227 RepID=R4UEX6_9MOLU|nr:type I phosphomannose isomerase catalytic subunit [Spiroplasma chrysopicola]AGM24650.1 mannose-6-phosphate isomerase [Spiroplasma chrysopicola DF-1]
MTKILTLKPFFSERLWGGRKLEKFGFELPTSEKYGEAWVISSLDNGMTYLDNNQGSSISLKQYFLDNRTTIFDNAEEFPLLSKIITANDYLSVQVHPDDAYSLKHNQMLGKPECWYIMDCPDNAKIIYGHNAKTKDELVEMIANKKWKELFCEVPIKKGDFVYVPPGKVHAITPGVTVFELQRSSDITYRFYDFDRADKDGNLRPLHIQECIDVTTVPDSNEQVIRINEGKLIDNEYFTLYLLKSNQTIKLTGIKWAQITLIKGSVVIDNQKLTAGQSALLVDLPENLDFIVDGEALFSYKK